MKNASRRRRDKWLKINLALPLRGIVRNSKEHLEAMQRRYQSGLPAAVPGDCEDMLNSGIQIVDGTLGENDDA